MPLKIEEKADRIGRIDLTHVQMGRSVNSPETPCSPDCQADPCTSNVIPLYGSLKAYRLTSPGGLLSGFNHRHHDPTTFRADS